MKNIKRWAPMVSLLMCACMLCSCSNDGADTNKGSQTDTTTQTEAEPEVNPAESGKLNVDFANGKSKWFQTADNYSNGDMFNVMWRKANCTFENGKMQLIIDKDPLSTAIPYSGAEYRSKGFYGYGRYEVTMKAIKNDGVVSSFFTYTGPSDNNPCDEIDIEILGKDNTKVQFNYYTSGKGNHEYMYDLGFDASEDFHTYAFEWHKDKIVWFVDGKEAYTADQTIPVTPSKIMMNVWCGKGVDGWLKKFDDSKLPLTAEYQSISFTAFDE